MKTILLLLVTTLAVIAVEEHHKGLGENSGYAKPGNKRGRLRGSRRPEWMTCDEITKHCKNSRNRKREKETVHVCGIVNGTYEKTYEKRLCDMKKAKKCDNMEILHYGKCGLECTEENLCTDKTKAQTKLAEQKKELSKRNSRRKTKWLKRGVKRLENKLKKLNTKTVCMAGSNDKMTTCEFHLARCKAAKNDDDLPERKVSCICDKENACSELIKMEKYLKKEEKKWKEAATSGWKKYWGHEVEIMKKKIETEKCHCNHKLAVCKAQETGTEKPKKTDCKSEKE